MKLLTVVGARPQFIKAAAVGYAIRAANENGADIKSVLVHTGQHYNPEMSSVFFEELDIQPPDHHLGVGSGSHGVQTGRMLEALDPVLRAERPDITLVYGDTNTTLAGAVAAAKLHVPVAHVEAGLRSFNRLMPEEINRVLTDHVSEWLFCPTTTAKSNLAGEGITRNVHVVGDVMHDLTLTYANSAALPEPIRKLGVDERAYALVTIHRAETTDDPAALAAVVDALGALAQDLPVVVPLHPRTASAGAAQFARVPSSVHVMEPFGYKTMIAAEAHAAMVITDSGGVQKEAFWLGVPCVTVRQETEWPETQQDNRNIVVAPDAAAIAAAARRQLSRGRFSRPQPWQQSPAATIIDVLRKPD